MPLFAKKPAQPPQQLVKGFDAVIPDSRFAATETGSAYWDWSSGKQVPYIQAEDSLPFVNIPGKLAELAKHCWKAASPATGPQRGPVTIGANMAPNFPFAAPGRPQQAGTEPGYVKQVTPLMGPDLLFAQDWGVTNELTRVNAYTFRGEERRPPQAVAADGGFHPPVSRTDQWYVDNKIFPHFQDYMKRRFNMDVTKDQFNRVYNQTVAAPQDRFALNAYFTWRDLVERESHHIRRMVTNPDLKNYISTTKYMPVAKTFAKAGGWIYVTRVRGGFDINSGKTMTNGQTLGEQEIALPGSLSWDDVFGFRQLASSGFLKFVGPVYLRQGFKIRNPVACREVYELLSGKSQG